MMRLLCVGDIHCREGEHLDDTRQALAFAAETADERDCHAVLVAGDLFEGRSSAAERVVIGEALHRLALSGRGEPRQVVVVRGNHDQPDELAVYEHYDHVTAAERPAFMRVTHPRSSSTVDVLCVPWPERKWLGAQGVTGEAGERAGSAALREMLAAMVATREQQYPLVVLGHLQVLGAQTSSAQPLIGRAIEAVLGDLQDLGAAAIVLGHVHKPQELAEGIEYVGSLTVSDFGEEGEEKRLAVLTVDDDGLTGWRFVPVPCRWWATIDARVELGDEGVYVAELHPTAGGDVQEMFGDCPVDDYDDVNVRYRYTCDETEEHLFDVPAIERRFRDAGAHTFKPVPVIERAQRIRSVEVATAVTLEQKLRAWGAATGTDVSDDVVTKFHELEVING